MGVKGVFYLHYVEHSTRIYTSRRRLSLLPRDTVCKRSSGALFPSLVPKLAHPGHREGSSQGRRYRGGCSAIDNQITFTRHGHPNPHGKGRAGAGHSPQGPTGSRGWGRGKVTPGRATRGGKAGTGRARVSRGAATVPRQPLTTAPPHPAAPRLPRASAPPAEPPLYSANKGTSTPRAPLASDTGRVGGVGGVEGRKATPPQPAPPPCC